jgi:ligand-binding sensor domain-containing protein/signal transduction histidine kinase
VAALLATTLGFALNPGRRITEHGHDVWQMEQGLPQNSVAALAQTADGFLWFGTEEGLVRFDGVAFQVFHAGNTKELRQNSITALHAGASGALWIGTVSGELSQLRNGRFTALPCPPELRSKRVNCVLEDADGSLWAGTEGGLVHGEAGGFRIYGTGDGLASERVRSLHRDREGKLWVGTAAGLCVREGGRLRRASDPWLGGASVMALCGDEAGGLWVGTVEGRLGRLAGGQTQLFGVAEGLRAGSITSLALDRDGSLWIGTRKEGVLRRQGGRFETYGRAEGLSDGWVLSLFEDREGSLWVGTYTGGLNRFRDTVFTTHSLAQGLPPAPSTALLEDPSGGVWVGSAAGLSHWKDGKAVRIPGAGRLSSEVILSLALGQDGSLWIGTREGLDRLRDGRLTGFTSRLGGSGTRVFSLVNGREGSLWIGTSGGLRRLKDGRVTTYGPREGLPDSPVMCLLERRDGSLWIGTQGEGVAELRDGALTVRVDRASVSGMPVLCLLEDGEDGLWMGLHGGGLKRFRQGKLSTLTKAQGLFDDSVFHIQDDGHGRFWMSSNKGIFRAEARELQDVAEGIRPALHGVSYGIPDGLLSAECNGGCQPAGLRTRDGCLWFPTTKGVAVVDPARLPLNPLPPPVHIQALVVDQKQVRLGEPLHIPPGSQSLEIHYTALSFILPERVHFEYLLEGLDREWVKASTRRVAYYTSLPPGTFRFRVRACNNDGVWNLEGASHPFEVAPRYYQTPWFYGFCGLLAVALGALLQRHFHRIRIRELELRNQVLDERQRLARDVHDQLSQTMTGLLLQLEAAGHALPLGPERCRPYLERASALAREGIAETRRTVQGLRATALDDGDLLQALGAMARRLTEGTPVRVEVDQMGSPFPLPRSVEDDLFRVGQEGITNALRHGQAHRIDVFVTWEEDGVRMSIRDDGRGLEASQNPASPSTGLGLSGMWDRIATDRGTLKVGNRPEGGTVVDVFIPRPEGGR